jgi:flagellar motor switch protein FliM
MADALSQKDIDSILKTGASAVESRPKPTVEAIPYNFRRPPLIHRNRQATLDAVYGRFALSVQAFLSSRLRTVCDIVVSSVEQATFAEFTFSLANPCAAFVFELQGDSSGSGVIDLGTDLAYYLVDRLFGGPGESANIQRPTTPLERLVVKGVTEKILALLGEAWEEYLVIKPSEILFESTPEAMQAVNREDNVLVSNLEVRAGEFSGWISICIPLLALEDFLQEKTTRSTHSTRVAQEQQEGRSAIEQTLRASQLPVTVRFPLFTLRARELSALKPDVTIHTNHMLGDPVEALVSGHRRFLGTVGQFRRHIGMQVLQTTKAHSEGSTVPMLRGKIL